jgi:hypothetical protein
MSVEGRTEAFFGSTSEYGKSPCFSSLSLCGSGDLGYLGYVSGAVNVGFFTECA